MLPFGHLGIGLEISKKILKIIHLPAIFMGSLMADMIDKPLYWFCASITGRAGKEIGIIAGTRTFSHTLLVFFILCYFCFYYRTSIVKKNFFIGHMTHLLLDGISGLFVFPEHAFKFAIVLGWPLFGIQFPETLYRSIGQMGPYFLNPWLVSFEVIGLFFLIRHFRS